MILRIIKYLLNLGGLSIVNYVIGFTFIFADKYPDCNIAKEIIWHDFLDVLPYILIYLAVSTICNFLGERYLEKRKDSREFLLIFLISTFLIFSVTALTALSFYGHCGE